MNVRGTGHRTPDRSTAPILSRQHVQTRKRNLARLPWWRQPPAGYLVTFPLVGLGLLIPFGLQRLGIDNAFLDTPFVLVTLIIALIWGTELAVLSILLGTLAFDIYFLPPVGSLVHDWHAVLQLIPFVLAEIIIVVLAAQRERGRRQILFAQHELEAYAGELEWVNQELERANQELEQANMLKEHFLSMASHELKTPITSIRGQAQLGMRRLTQQAELPAELAPLRTALERIDQQTHRLNSLVDDLLDLSILRSGKMTLRSTRCDVGEMCREVIILTTVYNCAQIKLTIPRYGGSLWEMLLSIPTGDGHDQEQDSEYYTRISKPGKVHSRHRDHIGHSQEHGAQIPAPPGTGRHAPSASQSSFQARSV